MRGVLRLIRLEVRFLKGSIVLIGLILAVFVSAFLSVASVWLDVPEGLYDYLETDYSRLAFSVEDVSIKEARTLGGDWVYGTKAGLTTDVVITGKGGVKVTIEPYEMKTRPFAYARDKTTRGFALSPSDSSHLSCGWGDLMPEGQRWPSAAGEIVMTSACAKSFGGVTAGDTVLVGDRPFTVSGVYSSTGVWNADDTGMPPFCTFYVCVSEDEVMDYSYVDYSHAQSMRADYMRALRRGYHAEIDTLAEQTFENIDSARAFFGAVAIVLGAMVLFVLYSLIAIFYRQRRAQICRFKLLGARNSTIAAVYCLIAIALTVFAVTAGAAGSLLFNLYFMRLCTTLFEHVFASHFRVVIPSTLLAGLLVFVVLLYAAFSYKIRNTHIAQEVKHE